MARTPRRLMVPWVLRVGVGFALKARECPVRHRPMGSDLPPTLANAGSGNVQIGLPIGEVEAF